MESRYTAHVEYGFLFALDSLDDLNLTTKFDNWKYNDYMEYLKCSSNSKEIIPSTDPIGFFDMKDCPTGTVKAGFFTVNRYREAKYLLVKFINNKIDDSVCFSMLLILSLG